MAISVLSNDVSTAQEVSFGFLETLARDGLAPLVRDKLTTVQVNLGKLCNQACQHCHVEAGPKRTENMSFSTVRQVVALLDRSPAVDLVDLTGGAPELNPNFRWLITQLRGRDLRVMDRCNLTVLFEPGQEDTADFLADQQVEVVASLPCYQPENVEKQRGRGVFDKSVEALKRLNGLGYGKEGSALKLDLVYNPVGPFLPPDQAELEKKYKQELHEHFGIVFHRLFTITNMPIKRFSESLARQGKTEEYMSLLVDNYNSETVSELMCKSLISVGWDGVLYDCDFNQMLELESGSFAQANLRTLWDLESFSDLDQCLIATDGHCFGCTAGAGSSCGGSLQTESPE